MNTRQMFDAEVAACSDGCMTANERRCAYAYFLRGWFLGGRNNTELAAAEERGDRLKDIVTALEDGCVICQYPKRVEELTCQKDAARQVISERDAEIKRLQIKLAGCCKPTIADHCDILKAREDGAMEMLAKVNRLMTEADMAHREYDETWEYFEQAIRAISTGVPK